MTPAMLPSPHPCLGPAGRHCDGQSLDDGDANDARAVGHADGVAGHDHGSDGRSPIEWLGYIIITRF